MADKVWSKCPICMKESTPEYHTNQKNFCMVNFSVGGNESVPYYGASFKACNECATALAEDENGVLSQIKELLSPIVAKDKAM